MPRIVRTALVIFLFLRQACAQLLVPCSTNTTSFATYDNLNEVVFQDGSGAVIGFCDGLFTNTDLILPIRNLSCGGEIGDFWGVRAIMGALPFSCRLSVARMMCYTVLPKARFSISGAFQGIAFPCTSQSSISLESWITTECSNSLSAISQILPVAKKIDSALSSSPTLQQLCRVVDLGSAERAEDEFPFWQPTLWDCPSSLALSNDLKSNSSIGCTLPCPTPVYSELKYQVLHVLLTGLNSISLVCAIFCILSWFLIRDKLQFPAILVLQLIIVCAGLHVSFLLGPVATHKTIKTINASGGFVENRYYRFDDEWCDQKETAQCAAQATLLLFFGKASIICWFCIIINAHLSFVYNRAQAQLKQLWKFYTFFQFGYPLIAVIIGLAAQKLEYSVGAAWCFISSSRSGAWQYGLFYGELIAVLIAGVYFSIGTTYYLHTHHKAITTMSTNVGQSAHTNFRTKVMIVLSWVFFQLLFNAAFRLDVSAHESEITNSVKDWMACEFSVYASNSNTACTISHTPSYALLVCAILLSGLDGTVCACLFGFTKDVRLFWYYLFKHIWYHYLKQESDPKVDTQLSRRSRFRFNQALVMARSNTANEISSSSKSSMRSNGKKQKQLQKKETESAV